MRLALLVVAFSAVSVLVVITVFIVGQGMPIMFRYGLKSFLAGSSWYPSEKLFGLWPMIVGSLAVTAGALVIGIPLGLSCAVVLTEFSSKRVRGIIKPIIELLAGHPLGRLRLHRASSSSSPSSATPSAAPACRSWPPRSSSAS